MSESLQIGKLLIVGVGLIGGSVARALREAHAAECIGAIGRSRETLQRAQQLGVIDEYYQNEDYAAAVADADLVLVATPVGAVADVFKALAAVLPPATVVTDAGSTKRSVLVDARAAFGDAIPRFVGSHPIAGAEHSGVEASHAGLFRDHLTALTPEQDTDPKALDLVRRMWRTVGSNVIELDATRHDQLLAATSHLPHIVAYTLAAQLGARKDQPELAKFSAGGLRDITRVASSDPDMWSDICIANREPLLALIREYRDTFTRIEELIDAGEREALHGIFEETRKQRRKWLYKTPPLRGSR